MESRTAAHFYVRLPVLKICSITRDVRFRTHYTLKKVKFDAKNQNDCNCELVLVSTREDSFTISARYILLLNLHLCRIVSDYKNDMRNVRFRLHLICLQGVLALGAP